MSGGKIYVRFSCGHEGYAKYYSRQSMMKTVQEAEEKGLCPECKRKKFLKEADEIVVPYSDYKEYFDGRRGVLLGKYNKSNNTIQIFAKKELVEKYKAEKEKVYICAEFDRFDNNKNIIISVYVCGNSYSHKEYLKKQGFKWIKNYWRKNVVVFPKLNDKTKEYWLPPEDNPEFYQLLLILRSQGFIDNIMLDLKKIMSNNNVDI